MNLALLNLDGSIDTNFVARPNARVLKMVPLADGKILISGNFTGINGIERNRIARLNSNGTVDETFNPGLGFDSFRMNIAEMPDGKILAASADFGHYDGERVSGLIRLLDPKPGLEGPTLTFAAGTEGNLQISLDAPLGANCALEISSDLETWTELEQTIVSESPVQFSIDPTSQTHLFYRVRVEP